MDQIFVMALTVAIYNVEAMKWLAFRESVSILVEEVGGGSVVKIICGYEETVVVDFRLFMKDLFHNRHHNAILKVVIHALVIKKYRLVGRITCSEWKHRLHFWK